MRFPPFYFNSTIFKSRNVCSSLLFSSCCHFFRVSSYIFLACFPFSSSCSKICSLLLMYWLIW
ncbi:hypothetical protein SAMD00023520_00526 [Listeria monocytogenes]|nr:hypothetical protein SAMD00023518_01790 [Listeria monocytogenes]GAT38007.1 hypothetical protein SAMD00023519_00168 [Listeria monocytogenes]GAT40592.1 hypothetical protein SAMD00023520_00526 [Listeria monocytogenes]